MELLQKEVDKWRSSETTKKIIQRMSLEVEMLKEMLVEGTENPDFVRGMINGIRMAFSIKGEDYEPEKE